MNDCVYFIWCYSVLTGLIMLILQLPEDVLYHILSYLNCKSLARLSQVCKSIYRFVNRDTVWRSIAKEFLNTGINRDGTDIYPHIPLKERVKLAQNWCDGVCKRAIPLKWKTKLLPWLELDGDVLFLSQAADIGAYQLHQESGRLQRNPFEIYSGHNADVCHFVLTDSHLISGGSDGKILAHSRTTDWLVELSGHKQEVNCLDSKDGLIISGSRDQTTRIWTLTSNNPRDTIPMYDRVWSVAISPTLSSFITGTSCCQNLSPLRIWDVERKCVMEWEEPHDSTLYCIQTDGNYMIASGSSYYGVVRLWDKRQSACLQFFQLSSESGSSPVYCLRFSSTHLYAALATSLHSLDFQKSPICIR
ncbi:F-box/WD repeat-containing protein 4 isoform X2 [Pleuronectes platessa]|uniref:F-box/WD repeat-containing protein 4 isoform X2 n=1 Tax=Pleuronectes platessa TaxID=8262 RepID=UPI00232A5533|nr:F-box/WD repeat-containing protein 4 isoform X2 [Pleuronectes platessa]